MSQSSTDCWTTFSKSKYVINLIKSLSSRAKKNRRQSTNAPQHPATLTPPTELGCCEPCSSLYLSWYSGFRCVVVICITSWAFWFWCDKLRSFDRLKYVWLHRSIVLRATSGVFRQGRAMAPFRPKFFFFFDIVQKIGKLGLPPPPV